MIEAVKELTNDFVILTGMAYFGNNHRPCQIIEINTTEVLSNVDLCVAKLKKILNVSYILLTRTETAQVMY